MLNMYWRFFTSWKILYLDFWHSEWAIVRSVNLPIKSAYSSSYLIATVTFVLSTFMSSGNVRDIDLLNWQRSNLNMPIESTHFSSWLIAISKVCSVCHPSWLIHNQNVHTFDLDLWNGLRSYVNISIESVLGIPIWFYNNICPIYHICKIFTKEIKCQKLDPEIEGQGEDTKTELVPSKHLGHTYTNRLIEIGGD